MKENLKTFIAVFNARFNAFPIKVRRIVLLSAGCVFAAACLAIIIKSISL